jgi:hypothetical protein
MKFSKFIYPALLLLLIAGFVWSCQTDEDSPEVEPVVIEAMDVRSVKVEYDVDTTTTAGTADTTIVTLPTVLSPTKVNLYVSLDSLSGAHNATHVLQVNASMTDSNTWYDLDTVIGNGVSVDDILSASVYYGRLRIYSISNGTAQSFEKKIAGSYSPITTIQ